MNTPKINEPKKENRVVNFAWDVFDVLWKEHEEIFDEWKNRQLDYFERLRTAVKEERNVVDYEYSNKENYKKRLLADNKTIEEAKEKLRNHPKLKSLIEEYKTIPGNIKNWERLIWKKVLWDLLYESMEEVWE